MTISRQAFQYRGRSMWPCFQEGDLLTLEPVPFHRIRVGDCIAYHSPKGHIAVHRVVAKDDRLHTRGDAMKSIDSETLKEGQIIGRVAMRHRLDRSSHVLGGLPGRMARHVFQYGGRINPASPSRGGKLARMIRKVSTFVLRNLRCSGGSQTFMRHDGSTSRVWRLGGKAIGRQASETSAWVIPWPWAVIIDIDACID